MALIYLYESTETDFRYNGKPLPKAVVDVSWGLNDEFYAMGRYPIDEDEVYKEIVEDRIVKVHTFHGMEPMRIVDVQDRDLYVEFEAWPLFFADMRNKMVKPLSLRNATGQTALNAFFNNLLIKPRFNFYSNITETHDYHTQDVDERENNPNQLYDALEVFSAIVRRWNGEISIRGYDIRMNDRIGTDTEALLYEKKNITEFLDGTNIKNIVTRAHGKAEWTEEGPDGEQIERSIQVTVDSPLINAYSGIIFERQYTNNDVRSEKELRGWLRLKFSTENLDKPTRSIEVGTNMIDGTKVGPADTLILKYIKHDVDMRIKIVGYEYDGFANKLKRFILGEPKATASNTIGNTITETINNVVRPIAQTAIRAQQSADGKRTKYSGTQDPNTLNLNANKGDEYWRDIGDETIIYEFNGTTWDVIIDTSETTKNAEAIEEAVQQVEQNKQLAEQQIKEAKEEAERLVTEQDEVYQELFDGYDAAVDDLTQGIADADTKAGEALTKAGESGTLAQSASELAEQAETIAQSAITSVGEAIGKADEAYARADNAFDAIADFDPLVSEAVSKADDAITKANNIPATVDNLITDKGLVSGDWVNTRIDDVTGEINYSLESVRGDVPDVVMGIEWDKTGSPSLTRTDYVEEFANLEDFNLQTADFNLSVQGLEMNLAEVQRDKLDSGEFTAFKTNEYTNTVNGITNRLTSVETNKLDGNEFQDFREHDYRVTVDGLDGNIQRLERDKLDEIEFSSFKSNEYELTVDGFNMELTNIEGAIPNVVLGVEWNRTESPRMERTDYTEELDLTNYDAPDYVMGVEWDKKENPILNRTDYVEEFANLDDYELQTAEFKLSVEGLGMDLAEVKRDKLDSGVFTTFKTNEYANDIDGIRQRLTSAEENKLDGSTFQNFKEHNYQVTVNGLRGNIQDLEREKLGEDEFTSFKSNEYANTVDGITNRLTSVETNKLDNSTFSSFKEHDYEVTVSGLSGRIQSVEENKVDDDEFKNFKENDYEMTVNGLSMQVTSVSGAIPNYVMGVKWNRTESPLMERTDFMEEIDLTNYDAPDYIMGVEWDKVADPTMVRTRDTTDNLPQEEFELFLSEYSFRADGWDATNAYITENSTAINSLISNAHGWSQTISYVDENQTKINETISQVDSYKQTIGSDGEKIAQLVMTDETFITRVGQLEDGVESTETQVAQLADSWVMRIKSGGDIKTAINATTDGLRLKGDVIHLSGQSLIDNAVIKSAHIDSLNVSKLTGTTAEFATLRSALITANVIEATHIKADNALFDMLFTSRLATDRLSAQTAWITNGMFANASIDGAKIQDATIGSAKIANLDVSKISGNHMSFITGAFTASNGDISIDGRQIQINSIDYANMRINRNNVEFSRGDGVIVGGLVATHNPFRPGSPIGLSLVTARSGQDAGIGRYIGNGEHIPSLVANGTTGNMEAYNSITMDTGTSLNFRSGGWITSENQNIIIRNNTANAVRIDTGLPGQPTSATRASFSEFGNHFYQNLNMNEYRITNASRIEGSAIIESGWYRGRPNASVSFGYNDNGNNLERFRLLGDGIRMYSSVNFDSYHLNNVGTINYASDARLKNIIGDRIENDLVTIMSIDYKNYYMNGQKQRGFIAQELQLIDSHLVSENENGMLSYDGQGYMHTIGHAVQQLAFKEQNTNKIASQALQATETNEEKIHQLQQELSKANRRIEELEGAM